MRSLIRYIVLFLLMALSLSLWATSSDWRARGTHIVYPAASRIDAVLLYADLQQLDAYLAYTGDTTCSWRDDRRLELSNADTFYPEHNHLYFLYEADTVIASIYVIDYSRCRPELSDLQAVPFCDNTQLLLSAVVPLMQYVDTIGFTHTIDRQCTVRYTSLGWGDDQWVDSTCVETLNVPQIAPLNLSVGAPLCNTHFSLSMDQFAEELGYSPDSILSDEMTAWAVACHPTTVTTARGTSIENEPNRPTSEEQLQGSAPLEVQFNSNANTPTAQFFRWEIYHGTELIASRTDEDQRYTFMTDGNYQVRLWVSNDHCTSDSTTIDVSISSSRLLVPNVFSPNGDGINDEFRVMYTSLSEFHCWVYNRWGHLVYEWTDPAKGWDGTIGGRPAAEGAYYYVIRAKGTDADPAGRYQKATDKRKAKGDIYVGWYQLSGDINLVR